MDLSMNRPLLRTAIAVLAIGVLIAGVWWFFQYRATWPRGEALSAALAPLIGAKDADQSLIASAILDNYLETRTNASRWSGIYWGFSFGAAGLSALAALILKLESFLRNEGVKKDVAAVLSVCAALLVTVSTSGDFHRKWQANRIAAAELERLGYQFLVQPDVKPRAYLSSVATILHTRHVAIVGMSGPSPAAEKDPVADR
jgi:hypothetical protein